MNFVEQQGQIDFLLNLASSYQELNSGQKNCNFFILDFSLQS